MSDQAKTAWTPGPWRAGTSQFYPGLDGPLTMMVYTDHPPTEFELTGENLTANARLIAAAPELYEALSGLVESHTRLIESGDCGFWDADDEAEIQRARAALAKARGDA